MADWRAPLHADAERKHNIVTLVRYDLDDFVGAILNPHPYRAALRAVLDLHPPRQAGTLTPWDLRCVGCSMEGVTAVEWPCKNVLAIARELGIEETGDAVRGYSSDMADLMAYDDLCARIYADRRMPPGTRELALTFAWTLLRDPDRGDHSTSSNRAGKLLGGARFKKLVDEDAPCYRCPQEWAGPCDGPRLRAYRPRDDSDYEKQQAERRASRCGTSASDRVYEYDMVTGQVSRVYWYCSHHQAEAGRVRQQLLERGTPPPAIPNQGGLLPCYYEATAVEKLYQWAAPRWTPPYHGVCADDWPVPGYELVPKRPRLALVVGGLESGA